MKRSCIVVADAGRARFFSVKDTEDQKLEGGPQLIQERDLAHPEGRATGQELFQNLKSGRNRAPYGPAHGFDDHRVQHQLEIENRFAKELAKAIAAFVEERSAQRLILAADPRLLGLLREPLDKELPERIERNELADDLSWHAVSHIEKVLIRRGLLSEKVIPAGSIYLPPGAPRS